MAGPRSGAVWRSVRAQPVSPRGLRLRPRRTGARALALRWTLPFANSGARQAFGCVPSSASLPAGCWGAAGGLQLWGRPGLGPCPGPQASGPRPRSHCEERPVPAARRDPAQGLGPGRWAVPGSSVGALAERVSF